LVTWAAYNAERAIVARLLGARADVDTKGCKGSMHATDGARRAQAAFFGVCRCTRGMIYTSRCTGTRFVAAIGR
jgi:hypothetical protein